MTEKPKTECDSNRNHAHASFTANGCNHDDQSITNSVIARALH